MPLPCFSRAAEADHGARPFFTAQRSPVTNSPSCNHFFELHQPQPRLSLRRAQLDHTASERPTGRLTSRVVGAPPPPPQSGLRSTRQTPLGALEPIEGRRAEASRSAGAGGFGGKSKHWSAVSVLRGTVGPAQPHAKQCVLPPAKHIAKSLMQKSNVLGSSAPAERTS